MRMPASTLHRLLAATVLAVASFGVPLVAQGAPRTKVVVISLDAFAAHSLHETRLPAPTLRALMRSGGYAVSMRPINPTITWPNHTSMVTGADASRHHVLMNGLITGQRRDAPPKVDMQASKATLVAVPTVYDAAHAAGLTTAQVDWVAIMRAPSIDWQFAEHPDPDGPIARDLVADGVLSRDDLTHFGDASQAWRDRIYTQAAVDIIRKHHPDLLLVHLLALDSIEHDTGYGNDAGRNTIAFLDDRVADIVRAVREAGELPNTAFLIVSDHGQRSVHWRLRPNVLLAQAGLQASDAKQAAYSLAGDGYALVYQRHATPASLAILRKLLAGRQGIAQALTPAEAARLGWPTPAQSMQAPDLLLYAKADYTFRDGAEGAYATHGSEIGDHGYPNTDPLMQGIFIATGRGVLHAGEVPAVSVMDVAPTIAALLGIPFASPQGKPIASVLAPSAVPASTVEH